MALQTLPVSFISTKYLGTVPKLRDGEQQLARDTSVPMWSVGIQAQLLDPRSGYPLFENIKVTITAAEAPGTGMPQMTDVMLEDLQAGAYARGESADFYFAAKSMQPARPQKS